MHTLILINTHTYSLVLTSTYYTKAHTHELTNIYHTSTHVLTLIHIDTHVQAYKIQTYRSHVWHKHTYKYSDGHTVTYNTNTHAYVSTLMHTNTYRHTH